MAEKKKTERKTVTVHLFRDTGEYSGDQIVGDGNKLWAIKRGVDVEVPEHIAKILEESLKRQNAVNELIVKESEKAADIN